jgi:ABC-type sugar transport system ATPase subunit
MVAGLEEISGGDLLIDDKRVNDVAHVFDPETGKNLEA